MLIDTITTVRTCILIIFVFYLRRRTTECYITLPLFYKRGSSCKSIEIKKKHIKWTSISNRNRIRIVWFSSFFPAESGTSMKSNSNWNTHTHSNKQSNEHKKNYGNSKSNKIQKLSRNLKISLTFIIIFCFFISAFSYTHAFFLSLSLSLSLSHSVLFWCQRSIVVPFCGRLKIVFSHVVQQSNWWPVPA